MSELVAVDVAILPPPAIAEAAIALNRRLPPEESKGLRLDDTHLPHITLTQHFFAATMLPAVKRAIEMVVRPRPPLALSISGAGRGSSSVWMRVARTPELAAVHAAVMEALRPFERGDGSVDAFVDAETRPEDVAWVSSFRASSAYDNFQPHITLGHASTLPDVPARSFFGDTIALCHLGRFCTCRTVLGAWTL